MHPFAWRRSSRNFVSKDCDSFTLGQITGKSDRQQLETILHTVSKQERFKGEPRGAAAPPVKTLPPVPPIKFMIKHNLPLVRGGSLWQYRSVPPAAIMTTPLPPPM